MYNVMTRLVAGIYSALGLFGFVLLLGGLQNGILWDHLTPADWNEWGVVILAGIAGGYGFYAGVSD